MFKEQFYEKLPTNFDFRDTDEHKEFVHEDFVRNGFEEAYEFYDEVDRDSYEKEHIMEGSD